MPQTSGPCAAFQQVDSLIRADNGAAASGLVTIITIAVVLVGLYFGRQVVIPLALAVVFAFLLTPAVSRLEKCRIGRVASVLVVLVLAFVLMSSVGWVVTGQLMNIVDQFPSYQSNIHDKIQSLRVPSGSRLSNATNTVTELSNELSAASESVVDKKAGKTSGSRPIPVQVAQSPANAPQYLRAMIGPLTGVVETSAMVVVFTLFILIKREDLRNRVIRLAGQGRLNVVTQALDDASRRLRRYLLLQFLVNLAYGVIFGSGAYWVGIPHVLLWGVLGGLLRFVPYVGTPTVAVFSMGMALAVFPGWHQAGLIFGLFLVLELILANIVEPWLYGSHTGISSLAILVAAVFWTILWGPVGLILSTPLTVCLILMGRYVPQLRFLEVLLGDEAALPVESHFYQRLLALDQEEASDIAEAYLKEKPIGSFYDSVLIPALALAEQDRHVNSLEAGTASFISQSTRDLIEDLGERSFDNPAMFIRDGLNRNDLDHTALSGLRVVCIPAVDEADETVAIMIAQLLKRLGCDVRHLPIASRANILDEVATDAPQVVLVSALPPFAAGHARSLCKRLRQRHPRSKMILGLWTFEGGVVKAQERVGSCGADMVAISLQQAISFLDETNQSIRLRNQTQGQIAFRQDVIATGS
jgi:predicted PurR-regulated permease PerM/methylmalonyl-CoA mutase cobalamin-binding subunit